MTVYFQGFTAKTPIGPVDLVPFLRRLEGDRDQAFCQDEQDAAVLALHAAGFGVTAIAKAVHMSGTEVNKVLAGERERAAVEEPEVPIRKRRKAERVLIDGRMVHPDAPHGTSTGYDHWWCRCLPCCGARAARAAQQRKRVAARKGAARGTDR